MCEISMFYIKTKDIVFKYFVEVVIGGAISRARSLKNLNNFANFRDAFAHFALDTHF